VDDDLRRRMGEAAVRLALAAGYEGAGTAEFLLDGDTFYFLEVNTRLQVEHPVTEMVTGRDLVRDQLLVAAGEPLGYAQEDVVVRGAAIELRVYAEDPDDNFFPSPGLITHIDPPGGPGIRHDCGVAPGSEVTLHYDSLIAKLIAWAPDRTTAIARALGALTEYRIGGVVTILPFLRRVLEHPGFRSGDYDTHLLDRMSVTPDGAAAHGDRTGEGGAPDAGLLGAVAAALHHATRPRGFRREHEGGARGESGWVRAGREVRSWPE
jgi:acetyl-CoA carboxylase biotin carboxylase subunit